MNNENLMTKDNELCKSKLEYRNGRIVIHKHINTSKDDVGMVNNFNSDFDLNNKNVKNKKAKKKLKKKKEKRKEKKEKKLRKKIVKKSIDEIEVSKRKPNIGELLANIFINTENIRVVREGVYLYDKKLGYFKASNKHQIQTRIKSWARKEYDEYSKICSRDYDEAYRMIMLDEKIQTNELNKAFNKPYILCKNGVLDIKDMKIGKISPKYEFTNCINAKFDLDAKGENFKAFLQFATKGNEAMKKLIQEIMGYTFSNYTNIRKAFMFFGISGTGKSTLLNIIRMIAGEENCTSVNIQDIEKEYYVANLLRHKLNIAPDLPNEPIKGEISKFKSLISELDTVSGRDPYNPITTGRGRVKFLFGSNHHLRFRCLDTGDLEAFFDRMIYIPFNNAVDSSKRDDDLSKKLAKEYDYIFTWSMNGLQRLIKNGYEFTNCDASEKCKLDAMIQYCPENVFYNECVKIKGQGCFESSQSIKDAFRKYCADHKIEGSFNICAFLKEKNIPKLRKRIDCDGHAVSDGNVNPIYVYEGIRVRKRYRC